MIHDDEIEKTIDGIRHIGRLDDSISRHIAYGAWEDDITKILKTLIEPGMAFIDVGANVGYHAISVAKVVGANGRCYAFEPQEEYGEMIAKTLAVNGITNVTHYPVALSDGSRDIFLSSPPKIQIRDSFYYNRGDVHILETSGEGGRPARCETLDSYDFSRVDIMKVDVQGSELAFLDGAENTIREQRPYIIIKLDHTSREVLGKITSFDYNIYRIDDRSDFACVPRSRYAHFIRKIGDKNIVSNDPNIEEENYEYIKKIRLE
jgi:FkbM family methyltransferase